MYFIFVYIFSYLLSIFPSKIESPESGDLFTLNPSPHNVSVEALIKDLLNGLHLSCGFHTPINEWDHLK